MPASIDEWRQLDRLNLSQGFSDHRQSKMRIFACIAMAGKMFAARDNAAVAQAAHPGAAHGARRLRVGAKGALAYNRIFLVGIHVQYRREIQIDADKR